MPDANKESTINALVGAAFGAAGQRCMALSTAVMVGDAKEWLHDVAEKASKLKVSAGHEPTADIPPVISPQSKERIHQLIQSAEEQGASILLDGRTVKVGLIELLAAGVNTAVRFPSTPTVTLLDLPSSAT